MDISSKVKELIANQLNKSIEEITNDKDIKIDLGADSLDIVEMIMAFEEEFEISVPDEDAVNIKTVGDVISLIESKK